MLLLYILLISCLYGSDVQSRSNIQKYEFIQYHSLDKQQIVITKSAHLICPFIFGYGNDGVIFPKLNQTLYQIGEPHYPDRYVSVIESNIPELIELGTNYSCQLKHLVEDKLQTVIRIDLFISSQNGYEYFTYETKNTVKFKGIIGKALTIVCGDWNDNNIFGDRVYWFFESGLQIKEQTTAHIRFDELGFNDLGIYYCTRIKSSNISSLPVQKIEVIASNFTIKTCSPQLEDEYVDRYYSCPMSDFLSPRYWNPVTWEYPVGNVLIGEFKPILKIANKFRNLNDDVSNPICRYLDEKSTFSQLALKRYQRSIKSNLLITISPRYDSNQLRINLTCQYLFSNDNDIVDLVYHWKNDQKETLSKLQTIEQDIYMYGSNHDMVRQKVFCQTESTDGKLLGITELDMASPSVSEIGLINLTETATKIYNYKVGESLELHCALEIMPNSTEEKVTWKLNSAALPSSVTRLDNLTNSMLIINRLSTEHEGTYACDNGVNSLHGNLIQRPIITSLKVEPKSEIRWGNADEYVKFTCRLDDQDMGNEFIRWHFIPEGREEGMALHSDITVERPATTPSLSIMTIPNVQKYHEGTYICKALEMSDTAKLTIKSRNLSVSPEEVQARPGTAVQFLCELSSISPNAKASGKVVWLRTDRRDLTPGKEEIISSTSGRALLIVKNILSDDHNTTYMCTDGFSSGYAVLHVREACAPGFRPCGTQKCVADEKFCDGVNDCEDGSDEILSKCYECNANEFACGLQRGQQPARKCYLQFWHCDGEDDCGNGFDEANCPVSTSAQNCDGTHFVCPTSGRPIARAFMCDGVPDCEPDGMDEVDCSPPNIIEPTGQTQLLGREFGNLTLTCIAHGRPPPALSWRYNWGPLKDGIRHVINRTIVDCNQAISHLTLIDLTPQASGLYTCEAVNRRRALAPDISLNVAKGGICLPPKFNDAAWFEDMCHECYCSNVTNQCQSAKGYLKSPIDQSFHIKQDNIQLTDYYTNQAEKQTVSGTIVIDDDVIRITDVIDRTIFLESNFGLTGSWVKSYGFEIKLFLRLFGENTQYISGPFLALHSSAKSMYWCAPHDRVILHSTIDGYENRLSIRLIERDRWFTDLNCTQKVDKTIGRNGFMQLLSNVQKIGVRVKSFAAQSGLELYKLKIEYAIKSDSPYHWVGDIEQCDCPTGYEGLSCEICSAGYQKSPHDMEKCIPFCACDQCDTTGRCLKCPGNRAGPKCHHCKPGYYRPKQSALNSDCVLCEKCMTNSTFTLPDCETNPQPDSDYFCKCPTDLQVQQQQLLIQPECDRCSDLAKEIGAVIEPDPSCDNRTEMSKCNPFGTESITGDGLCQCETGYTGPLCDNCVNNYFKYNNECLSCYCAGKTTSCSLSTQHYFWNITMANPEEFRFDIWLGRRTSQGSIERVDKTTHGKSRINHITDGIHVINPLFEKGVMYIGVELLPQKERSHLDNDLPIYRYMYGGKMSFRLDSIKLNPHQLIQSESSVVIELQSPRYGRAWALAIYNINRDRYEIQIDENWWPGGWRLGIPLNDTTFALQPKLNRPQLLRLLAAVTNMAIVTSSGESNANEEMKLTGLAIQVALPTTGSARQATVNEKNLPIAPVEICNCPNEASEDERQLSPSCEGCRNAKQLTVIRLQPYGEDLTCGGCAGPDCGDCAPGEYNYDVYTGTKYEKCRKGLSIDTRQQQIIVNRNEPIYLNCLATSYRDGLVKHNWLTPDYVDKNRAIINRTELIEEIHNNQIVYKSRANLYIANALLNDTGEYQCIASGVGAKLQETFYVVVRDPSTDTKIEFPEDDILNRNFTLPIPTQPNPITLLKYNFQQDPSDPNNTIVRGQFKNPNDYPLYHMIWSNNNGTIIPSKLIKMNYETGEFDIELTKPYQAILSPNESVNGYYIGKDPVFTPFWSEIQTPQIVTEDFPEVTSDDITGPQQRVVIPFMQPYKLQVSKKPGKSDILVKWRRIDDLPEAKLSKLANKTEDEVETKPDDTKLPEGMGVYKNNLMIWAAAEQHEGVYEAIVYRAKDNVELGRYQTSIYVEPMNEGSKNELEIGKASEPTEYEKDKKPPPVWEFLLSGFTPEAQYCEYPSWTLVDFGMNKSTDISHKVSRLSASNFRVDFPLSSGIYLRFQCQPVPASNLTGETKFNISSPEPRIVFDTLYENPNSTFPTRLICMDLNPEYDSQLSINSVNKKNQEKLQAALISQTSFNISADHQIPNRYVELNWQLVGEFDPFNDAGQYECYANNTKLSGSKTVTLPDDNALIPVEEGLSRMYLYSPDAYITKEIDGLSKIEVVEGEKLRIYCIYDSRPVDKFLGWRTESESVQNNMKFDRQRYAALISTDQIVLDLNSQLIDCVLGDEKKQIQIKVIPKTEQQLYAKVVSDSYVDGRLIGITGGDLNLTCDVQSIGKRPPQLERIDWYMQYENGIRKHLLNSNLSSEITTSPRGDWIYFRELVTKPQGTTVFCVLRPVNISSAKQSYHASPHVTLWIRKPKIIVDIENQDQPGLVTGKETQTIKLQCTARDAWFNKTIKNANYKWERSFTSAKSQDLSEMEEIKFEPTSTDLPMTVIAESNSEMILAGLRNRPNVISRFRCYAEHPKTRVSDYSPWVRVEVLAGDALSQLPKLKFIPKTDPTLSPYPYEIKCVDENSNHTSQVVWERIDGYLSAEQIERQPNLATLKWGHNGSTVFVPNLHAGLYVCKASNPYSTTTKQIYLPLDVMLIDSVIPKSQELRITSTINDIVDKDGKRYVRVIQGQLFELICNYYGHPPPRNGLQWSIHNLANTNQSVSPHWLSKYGLIVRSLSQYWSEIRSNKFAANDQQSGTYHCTALNEDGELINQTSVNVELYKVYVTIDELPESGIIESKVGQNGTITCNAYDGYSKTLLPDVNYSVEVRKLNGQLVPMDVIADEVKMINHSLIYHGLSDRVNELRIRCLALNDSASYASKEFGFSVQRALTKQRDRESGATIWLSGEGDERITLKITGINEATGHVTVNAGENVNLTCSAYDTITKQQIIDRKLEYGWRIFGSQDEPIALSNLAKQSTFMSTNKISNTAHLYLTEAKASTNLPLPSARIQCLATAFTDGITYYSPKVDLLVYPDNVQISHFDEVKNRDQLNRFVVKVIGLDDQNMLSGKQGMNKSLQCLVLDRTTNQPVDESVNYSWEFSRLDGAPVDTDALLYSHSSGLVMNNSMAIFNGLIQTSAVRGRCKATIPTKLLFNNSEMITDLPFYSPYFRFNIIDDDGVGEHVFIPPSEPTIHPDVQLKIDGLDESGHLSAEPMENKQLICSITDQTNYTLLNNATISYGWELSKLNGLPASSSSVAETVEVDSLNGKLTLGKLRSQPDKKSIGDRIRGRCIVSITPKLVQDNATAMTKLKQQINERNSQMRYTSPYFLFNVPKQLDPIPEHVDVNRKRYEVIVKGLNNYGLLKVKPGENVHLQCVVRDVETDTLLEKYIDTQSLGWQFPVLPSGVEVNPGDVTEAIKSDGQNLYLQNISRNIVGDLRGRCWFFDGTLFHYSNYFPLVSPRITTDGRVRVEVQEWGTDPQKRFTCVAYDTVTGVRLNNVTYDWEITTSTGKIINPAYYFMSYESSDNQLLLDRLGTQSNLPAHLQNEQPIEGRCIVFYQPYGGDLNSTDEINVYKSSPFIVINPSAVDPVELITPPNPFVKSHRVYASIEGVSNGLVTGPVNGTVSLTCKAIDSEFGIPVENLSYHWEIKQRDHSPIDTAVLANKALLIEGPGGQRLTIIGLNSIAVGLIGRCIITNDTKADPVEKFTVLVRPNDRISSPHFGFSLFDEKQPNATYKDDTYRGDKTYDVVTQAKIYDVVVSGLDKPGILSAPIGSNVTLQASLRNIITGQIKSLKDDSKIGHFGIETIYADGYAVPVSELADSISIHSETGQLNLYGLKNRTEPPTKLRFVIERQETDLKSGKNVTKPVRYASDYIYVIPAKEDGTIEDFVAPSELSVRPVVDGLNECGALPTKPGSDIKISCRPNDTTLLSSNLIYGWDIRNKFGQTLPLVNLLAETIKRENNRLILKNVLNFTNELIGRCVILTTIEGKMRVYKSDSFEIGSYGIGCDPSQTIILPDKPGGKPVSPSLHKVLIRIDGLNDEGKVQAQPGDNITLKCSVYNTTNMELMENVSIGWNFVTDTDELLYTSQLAQYVETGQPLQNEIKLYNLFENANARSRCMVTIDQEVTLSSPYFVFNVTNRTQAILPVSPTHSDQRVIVEVNGLTDGNRITLKRVGDDSTLKCQAFVVSTSIPLLPIYGVRYGWEWRYFDDDPVATSSVAVGLEADGERLELRGVQAEAGTKARSVKGRCIVHVPANLVDSVLPKDTVYVYGSKYFVIDVAKSPVKIDDLGKPIPGKYSDDIEVVIDGLASNGYLVNFENESANVVCNVRNRTTKQSLISGGLNADYSVQYGWEFSDATGRSVDSSLFADSVATDAFGNLRLKRLSAPTRGNLPFKIRCISLVSKRPKLPDQKHGPTKIYESDYFGLDIKRKDGSSTTDDIDKTQWHDVTGKAIKLQIDGLQPDGTLTAQPGDDVILKCVALDTRTNSTVENLIYGWEARTMNGNLLHLGVLAQNVTQNASILELYSMKLLKDLTNNVQGRCVVHRDKQIYRSDYFKVKVAVIPKGQQTEGDGSILVQIKNYPPEYPIIKMKPNMTINLQCIGIDAYTNEIIDNLQYRWDYETVPHIYDQSDRNNNSLFIRGSLGSSIEVLTEKTEGILTLQAKPKKPIKDATRIRCAVIRDYMVHTSPYYQLIIDDVDRTHELAVNYPKYRVKIDGFKEDDAVTVRPGENATFKCVALDAQTGQQVENIKYKWSLHYLDDEPLIISDLVQNGTQISNNEIKFINFDTQLQVVKIKCHVAELGSPVWDSSPYFRILINSTDMDETVKPEDKEFMRNITDVVRPIRPPKADVNDPKVTIHVTGLNKDNNLIATVGSNHALTMTVEKQDDLQTEILSYDWIIMDTNGNLIPINELADEVIHSTETGQLILNKLRPTNFTDEKSLKGQGVVYVAVIQNQTTANGSSEEVRKELTYTTKPFGIAITEDGIFAETVGGLDIQGTRIIVSVNGLSTDGRLIAEPGDEVTLQCNAFDSETKQPVTDGIYIWNIYDGFGKLASQTIRSNANITFVHFKPKSTVNSFGLCKVYIPLTKHIYQSPEFPIDVRQTQRNASSGPDDRVKVIVKGKTDDGYIVAREGDTKVLECQAIDTKSGIIINSTDAVYQFQFVDTSLDKNHIYGGYLADEVIQEPLPNGGIKLTLKNINAGKWFSGYCMVNLIPTDMETGEKQKQSKQYTSDYFWSRILGKDGDTGILANQTYTINDITYDPNVIVKLYGVNANNTITSPPGGDLELKAYAIDLSTGQPVDGMQYSWELRGVDDQPVRISELGKEIITGSELSESGNIFKLTNYNPSGEGNKIRCFATATDAVINPNYKDRTYASPFYTFETKGDQKTGVGDRTKQKYDPANLQVIVNGLNIDGTLTTKEGEDATLICQVINAKDKSPVVDQFKVGWTISTGPDNRPIPLNNIAETIHYTNEKLVLNNLKPVFRKSGGLRGYCSIQLTEMELINPEKYQNKTVNLNSDVFVIYVDPKDEDKTISTTDELSKPFTIWIPGKDPKNAVQVKVFELQPDGNALVKPGEALNLSCIAVDAVNLKRISPDGRLDPIFSWELRKNIGGQLLPYGEVANDKLIIKQPTNTPKDPSEVGVSTIILNGMHILDDMSQNITGRCVVQLGKQLFTSQYFTIKFAQSVPMIYYPTQPDKDWFEDKSIELIVKGLDSDGQTTVLDGSDVKLQCEARNKSSQEILDDNKLDMGWQFMDQQTHIYMIPQVENSKLAGSELNLDRISLPNKYKHGQTLFGWCVADQTKGHLVQHFRSEPFSLTIKPIDKSTEQLDKLEPYRNVVFVEVVGINNDRIFDVTEGNNLEIECRAIDIRTGKEFIEQNITFGWDWRNLNGDLQSQEQIAKQIKTEKNKIYLENINSSQISKGRCLVEIHPKPDQLNVTDLPLTIGSGFFFLRVVPTEPRRVYDQIDKDVVLEAKDDDVVLEVSPTDSNNQLVCKSNDIAAFKVQAKMNATNINLDKNTEPKLLSYSYQLYHIDGQPAHTGELGEFVTFDRDQGSLIVRNAPSTIRPLKLRFSAIVSKTKSVDSKTDDRPVLIKPGVDEETVRYYSEYYPIVVEPTEGETKPNWSKLPLTSYDLKENSVKVIVDGLNDQGDVEVMNDADKQLICLAIDTTKSVNISDGVDYNWQFIDQNDRPINPGYFVKTMQVQNGRQLYLKGIKASGFKNTILRGRCVVDVPLSVDETAKPLLGDKQLIQKYESDYFKFILTERETVPVTPPPDLNQTTTSEPNATTSTTEAIASTTTDTMIVTTPGEYSKEFVLKIESAINPVYTIGKSQHTLLARSTRPLELTCKAVFADQRASADEHRPQLIWYYRQPEIPGDVPIPSQLVPVSPPGLETLNILPQKHHAIKISSDGYTFRDDVAEFQCRAFMDSDTALASEVVTIQKIQELYDVRIFDEESRSRVYTFVNTSKQLTCYVDNQLTGERVQPSGYQWEMSLANGNGVWNKSSDVTHVAKEITGWETNQLNVIQLDLPRKRVTETDPVLDEAIYEFRCIALHNATFYTASLPFMINVRVKPEIKSIQIERVKPKKMVLDSQKVLTDSFDATKDYELICKPNVTAGDVVALWQKCEDELCTVSRNLVPIGDKLFLFANSTRYVDDGQFRCQTNLQLKEFNYKSVQYRHIIINREAAPAIYSSEAINYTVNDEMSLQCTDEASSPESSVEWTFEPIGEAPPENRHPLVLGQTYAYGRIYIFAIQRGQLIPEHSGKYTCTASNPFGTAKSSITVKVIEESIHDSLRFIRTSFLRRRRTP